MAFASREFIAVPDDRKGQILFKWPDVSIRRYSRAIVDADEMAVFVNTGRVVAVLAPGRHQIDAQEIPGLGAFIDAATGGNAYRAELYFIGTREYVGQRFGGRIDEVQDPASGLIVTLRVFGEYALRVVDPVRLITNLVGTVDLADNDKISGWMNEQVLKVIRATVTSNIVRNGWPILGLSSYTPDIEAGVIAGANQALAEYGVAFTKFGNVQISLAEEDLARLKSLANDVTYSRLAGGFQQYAQGEAMLGAGQGLALGGGGGAAGVFVNAGLGQQIAAPSAPVPPPAAGLGGSGTSAYGGPAAAAPAAPTEAAAPATPTAPAALGAGAPAEPAGAGPACAQCGAQLPPGARFCGQCGTAAPAPAPHACPNCNAEVAPGAAFCSQCGTRQ